MKTVALSPIIYETAWKENAAAELTKQVKNRGRFYFCVFSFLFLAACLFPSRLNAEVVKQAHTEVELVSEIESLQPGSEFRAAVRFKMDPGWHIYWKNPGDSGTAPKIVWHLPEGITAGSVEWPFPEKIEQPPLATYGYKGEVFLATPLNVSKSLKSETNIILKVVVNWLACEVDCIPGKAELELSLAVLDEVPKPDPEWLKAFAATRDRLSIVSADWHLQAGVSGEVLILEIKPPAGVDYRLSGLYFFPEHSELIQHAAPQNLKQFSDRYVLEIPLSVNYPKSLKELRGVILSEGWRGKNSEQALEVNISLSLGDILLNSKLGTVSPELRGLGFLTAMFFAFLGGLILNLMPCVLPVLSLKILGFVKEAHKNPHTLFKHGLVFTAGVILSFWVLAGLLIAFQLAGRYVGWGFQLQSPAFLIGLSFLFFLFALNLFGVFEVGTSLMGFGQSWTKRHDLISSFSSGVLAAIVATPCTAPFMGSALGFALAQPAWVSLAIFTSLGLGMAAPYLLICSHPTFIRFVPKPGAWMVTLKQFLGFLLIGTTLWLAWVLSLQKGEESAIWLFLGLFCAGFAVWIFGKGGGAAAPRTRVTFRIITLLLIGLGIFAALQGTKGEFSDLKKAGRLAPSKDRIPWEPYSEERLAELRREGRPVFIDFTAAWCLTCQVNERIVLNSPKVVEAFRTANIAALKADWTSQDEQITKALAQYGRNSIPLYVLYAREAGKPPVILPEILTPAIVLEAIRKLEEEK